jgi:uncharacterized protein (DUF58 family)
VSAPSTLSQLWAKADRPGVRAFFLSLAALSVALLLALYSGVAAEMGHLALAASSALLSLAVAAWVGVTLVPTLAKRTPLRWLSFRMEYKISREGWIYIGGVLLIALAALNTGNNLLFLILACLIAVILISGILSSITLSGVNVRLDLPEHIFAGQTVRSSVVLENEKITLPSFSLRVEAVKPKSGVASAILETPVFFPYVGRHDRVRQSVPMTFPRRGLHRQDAFRVVTRFPFGFLQKARRLNLKTEALVYPPVDAATELVEILPGLQGAMESLARGRGQDLYALRDYTMNDSVRHVHWKASARSGSLMVREFTRDDDARVLLVLDPHIRGAALPSNEGGLAVPIELFERAVNLCAALAWHFAESNAQLQFRSAGMETPLASAKDIIFLVLRHLAMAQPLPSEASYTLMSELTAAPNLFKIIVTGQPRGSIPASLWHSSYVVFLEDTAAGAANA